MPHVITHPCVGKKRKRCAEVCPVECIRELPPDKAAGFPDMLYIDPEECIDCGTCEDECPEHAIYPEDDVPQEWKKYIQINADMAKAAK
jgi:NAD-dependent dihydropyrimidine dehydrogenase PreA subunit